MSQAHRHSTCQTPPERGSGMEDVVVIGAGIVGLATEDFLVRSTARQVHVCNAPSSAATSAIPIGEMIGREVLEVLGP